MPEQNKGPKQEPVDPHELKPYVGSITIPMMRAEEEWAAFVADVKERGIVEPLHLAADGVTVLDGRHRLKAALEVGLERVPVVQAQLHGLSEEDYALRAAVCRRHLTREQRAVLARELEKLLVASSKQERAREGGKAKGGKKGKPASPCSEDASTSKQTPRARTRASKAFSSPERDVKKLGELERGAPDLAEAVKREDMKLDQAHREMRRRKKQQLTPAAASQQHPDVGLASGILITVPEGVNKEGDYIGELVAVVREKRVLTVWRLVGGDFSGAYVAWTAEFDATQPTIPIASDMGKLAVALAGEDVKEFDLGKQIGQRASLRIAIKPWGAVVAELQFSGLTHDRVDAVSSVVVDKVSDVKVTSVSPAVTVSRRIWAE